jgi:purine-nucleoside phosphorylase
MSIHIGANQGDISDFVLLPGDPLRAKFIAETFLENAVCYSEIRGMLGFTGTYKGKRVSVQGTGMGLPSHLIYVNELINDYDVKTLIRVGTCGGLIEEINVRDVVMGISASTDSAIISRTFNGMSYAPTASYKLILKAAKAAETLGIKLNAGNVFSSDVFYMMASKFHVDALSLLTVSDHLITGEHCTPDERQTAFVDMIHLALKLAE